MQLCEHGVNNEDDKNVREVLRADEKTHFS